jgi:hypothetical protein
MVKPKEESKPSGQETAVVLFGGDVRVLPQELEELGLGGKVEALEIPGVPPTWKPTVKGDFLLGRCVDAREKVFVEEVNGVRTERKAPVLVFETAVPGGFRSVWLGADLRLKLNDPVGQVFQIYYEGTSMPTERSRKLNPMKTFRVIKILPKLVSE